MRNFGSPQVSQPTETLRPGSQRGERLPDKPRRFLRKYTERGTAMCEKSTRRPRTSAAPQDPAYPGARRPARRKPGATGLARRVPPACAQKTRLWEAAPRGNSFSPTRRSSEFLCKGILRAAVQGHRSPVRAARSGAREGMESGRRGGRAPGVRLQRRGARLPLPRLPRPRRAAQPARIGRPAPRPHPHGREAPPRARRGRAARSREGGAGRGGPRSRTEAGTRGCGLGDQQHGSALSLSAVEWAIYWGCSEGFFLFVCLLPATLGRHTRVAWPDVSKCKSVFFWSFCLCPRPPTPPPQGSLHPFKAKRCVFKRASVLSFSCSKCSKMSPTVSSQTCMLFNGRCFLFRLLNVKQ